jgi:hypothetical protein
MSGFKTDISFGYRWVLDFEPKPKPKTQRDPNSEFNFIHNFFLDSKIFWSMTQTQIPLFLGVKMFGFKPKT